MPAQVIAASRRAATARDEMSLPPRGDDVRGRATGPRAISPWLVFAASVAFFSAIVSVYWNASLAHFNDARYYVSMAQHPFHFTVAPWGFRILTPILVWLIHAPAVYGFAAVNVISLAATAAMLYAYLLEFYEPRVAMFGVALFAVSPAVLIEMKWVVDVDAFLFAMVMLAFLALARRQWALLGAAMVLGVLDKETMLFVLLPLAVVGYSEYRFAPRRRWMALLGLPVLIYVLVHYTPLVFRPVPGTYDYFSISNLRFVFHEQQQLAGGGAGYSFFWSMVDTFGALWILAMLFVRRADRRIRHTIVFLVPVLASVLLADNWSRVLALAFVVIIPLVCAAGLSRPIAAAGLMFTYDAIVSLGVKNLSGHAGYAIEVPLLIVAVASAFALARPQVAPRVLATAASPTTGTPRGLASTPRPARATVSNGTRQAPATLRSAAARLAPASHEPTRATPARILEPAAKYEPRTSATPEPAPLSPTEPRVLPRVAAATNGSPARPTVERARPARVESPPPARTVASRPERLVAQSAPPSPKPLLAPQTETTSKASRRMEAFRPAPAPAPAAPAPAPPPAPLRPPRPTAPAVARPVSPRTARRAAWLAAGRPARTSVPPAARPAPRAPTPREVPPAPRGPRSEAVVHLEAAESLLADVQRLVDAAASGR